MGKIMEFPLIGGRIGRVIEGPNPADLRHAFRVLDEAVGDRHPNPMLFFGLSKDRMFLGLGDLAHADICSIGSQLGYGFPILGLLMRLKDETHGVEGLFCDELNRDEQAYAMLSVTPALWRALAGQKVWRIDPAAIRHGAPGASRWILDQNARLPWISFQQSERQFKWPAEREDAARKVWDLYARQRLEALLPMLDPRRNMDALLIAKTVEALKAGLSWSIDDKNAFALSTDASHYIQITDGQNGRIDDLHVVSTRGDRSARLAWRDQFVPSHRWPGAIERHWRTVSVLDQCWSDGEEIDPVDRIMLEATYAAHLARNGFAIGVPTVSVPKAGAEYRPADEGPPVSDDRLEALQADWRRRNADAIVQSADRVDRQDGG